MGDPISDLTEDMAAEQKARTTYDNILALSKNEDVNKVIRFLREREIVHYQRFAEGLEYVKSQLNKKNYYADVGSTPTTPARLFDSHLRCVFYLYKSE